MFTNQTMPLSALTDGTSARTRRDAQIGNVGKIPSRLDNRLVYVGNAKYLGGLADEVGIAAVVVPEGLADLVPAEFGVAVADNPHVAAVEIFERLIAIEDFHWRDFPTQVAPSAQVHPSAVIADRNVIIGARTIVEAGTVIRERTIIGDDCRIGALNVIGSEGFDVAPGTDPQRLMKQAGGVRIESGVTILNSITIARAIFGGFTEIRAGVCIDNQVYIAHDVDLGRDIKVCAGAGIYGRVVVGDGAYIGPNATISNGLTIGRKAFITLGAAVTRDVEDDARVTGNFAVPHAQWIKFVKSVAGAE